GSSLKSRREPSSRCHQYRRKVHQNSLLFRNLVVTRKYCPVQPANWRPEQVETCRKPSTTKRTSADQLRHLTLSSLPTRVRNCLTSARRSRHRCLRPSLVDPWAAVFRCTSPGCFAHCSGRSARGVST